ncbi:DUF305 domain-containing protein [Paraburkholderia sp. BR14320]|uniref:DUF305 domain-containing protein n=1 Tax=Paraburkholderia sp. BR14264 TaxID=3237001 RepID=UPI0034D0E84F
MFSVCPRFHRVTLALGFVLVVCISSPSAQAAGAVASSEQEAPFLSENDRAMTAMMNGMPVHPTGDVDQDFVAMMVPHHQGAIDMAQAELRHGHDERLRRIAQEIIVAQQQEIVAMRLALGQPLPAPEPAPDQLMPGPSSATRTTRAHDHTNMNMSKDAQ